MRVFKRVIRSTPLLGHDQFYADQGQHDDEQYAQETLGNEAAQVAADVDTGQ